MSNPSLDVAIGKDAAERWGSFMIERQLKTKSEKKVVNKS